MLDLYCVSELLLTLDILGLTVLLVLAAVVDFVGLTFPVEEVDPTEELRSFDAVG